MSVSIFKWDEFVSMCGQINKEPTKEDWVIARIFHNLGKIDGYNDCLKDIGERKMAKDIFMYERYLADAARCHKGFVASVLNGNCEQ